MLRVVVDQIIQKAKVFHGAEVEFENPLITNLFYQLNLLQPNRIVISFGNFMQLHKSNRIMCYLNALIFITALNHWFFITAAQMMFPDSSMSDNSSENRS